MYVHSTDVRLCFRDKGVPTDWTKAASRQLEELRPSLASCLPALQTATPISQLTPETSFPCCRSWRRPLSAPPMHPLSWSSCPTTTMASEAVPRGGGRTISGGRGRRRKLRRQIILPELYSCSSSMIPRRFWRGILGEKDSDIWRRQGRKYPLGYRRQNDQVGPQKPLKGGGALDPSNTQLQTLLVHMPVDSILEQSVDLPAFSARPS